MGLLHRHVATAVFSAALLASSVSALAGSPAEREYDRAVQSFRAGRLSEAFGQFMELANRGDVDSARVALFMHSYGPVLYGKYWDAGPQNLAYWDMLIRNSGTSARPIPEYQPTVLKPGKGKTRPVAEGARPAGAIASIARN